jgi:hypothetical protein
MHIVAAGMHDRHRLPVSIRRPDLAGIGPTGNASMSARNMTAGPSPLRNSPTTPVFPTAVVTS